MIGLCQEDFQHNVRQLFEKFGVSKFCLKNQLPALAFHSWLDDPLGDAADVGGGTRNSFAVGHDYSSYAASCVAEKNRQHSSGLDPVHAIYDVLQLEKADEIQVFDCDN